MRDNALFIFAAIQALGVILLFFRIDVRLMRRLMRRLGRGSADVTSPSQRERLMTLFAVGSLCLAAYGLWNQPKADPFVRVVKTWGTTGGYGPAQGCRMTIDGARLADYARKFDLAITCGVSDPTIDPMNNVAISVSRPITIQSFDFEVEVAISPATRLAAADIVRRGGGK